MQNVSQRPQAVRDIAWIIAMVILAMFIWFFFSANQSASKQVNYPGIAERVTVPVQLDSFRRTQL